MAGFSGFHFAHLALFAITGNPAKTNTDERLPVRRAPGESWKSYNPANPDSDKKTRPRNAFMGERWRGFARGRLDILRISHQNQNICRLEYDIIVYARFKPTRTQTEVRYETQPRTRADNASRKGPDTWLRGQLKEYNDRDYAAVNRHIDNLRDALEQSESDVIRPLFGGSVGKFCAPSTDTSRTAPAEPRGAHSFARRPAPTAKPSGSTANSAN